MDRKNESTVHLESILSFPNRFGEVLRYDGSGWFGFFFVNQWATSTRPFWHSDYFPGFRYAVDTATSSKYVHDHASPSWYRTSIALNKPSCNPIFTVIFNAYSSPHSSTTGQRRTKFIHDKKPNPPRTQNHNGSGMWRHKEIDWRANGKCLSRVVVVWTESNRPLGCAVHHTTKASLRRRLDMHRRGASWMSASKHGPIFYPRSPRASNPPPSQVEIVSYNCPF